MVPAFAFSGPEMRIRPCMLFERVYHRYDYVVAGERQVYVIEISVSDLETRNVYRDYASFFFARLCHDAMVRPYHYLALFRDETGLRQPIRRRPHQYILLAG